MIEFFKDDKPFNIRVKEAFETYKKIYLQSQLSKDIKENQLNEKLINMLNKEISSIFDLTL